MDIENIFVELQNIKIFKKLPKEILLIIISNINNDITNKSDTLIIENKYTDDSNYYSKIIVKDLYNIIIYSVEYQDQNKIIDFKYYNNYKLIYKNINMNEPSGVFFNDKRIANIYDNKLIEIIANYDQKIPKIKKDEYVTNHIKLKNNNKLELVIAYIIFGLDYYKIY